MTRPRTCTQASDRSADATLLFEACGESRAHMNCNPSVSDVFRGAAPTRTREGGGCDANTGEEIGRGLAAVDRRGRASGAGRAGQVGRGHRRVRVVAGALNGSVGILEEASRGRSDPPAFVEVPLAASGCGQIEIAHDGVVVRVREDLDVEHLARIRRGARVTASRMLTLPRERGCSWRLGEWMVARGSMAFRRWYGRNSQRTHCVTLRRADGPVLGEAGPQHTAELS
jgi:hypothetical protein